MQAYQPSTASSPIQAAQYVRASTDHQQYSIENQSLAIANYATEHNMRVVQTYADDGKSGLTLRRRKGLRQLLQDVENGEVPFSIVLVYDVSRWGRFQDVDESAYYEYRCKRAKMAIHYCAEPFANDGSISSALLKTLKRTMAGEYSRELSVKVFAGQCRLVERGFRQGGTPGFGLRRLLVDSDGRAKGVLKPGEYKCISTDRVILVPGPPEEISRVHDIYRQFVDEHKPMYVIANELNQRGIASEHGGLWTTAVVWNILTNPKYVGNNVTNKKSCKLKAKSVVNPPEMWVRRDGAFQPLVSLEVFKKAQDEVVATRRRRTDEEVLALLKHLLLQVGRLTGSVINKGVGLPRSRHYQKRFGGLLNAYRQIGYFPTHDFSFLNSNAVMKVKQQEWITALVMDLQKKGATVDRNPDTDVLTINDELTVRFLVCRCCRSKSGPRWYFRPESLPPCDITIEARMNPRNDAVLDYFVVPRLERFRNQSYYGSSKSVINIFRFDDLSVLDNMVRRTTIKENA